MKIVNWHLVKNNLLAYALGIIVLMTILSLFAINMMIRYKDQMESMFEKHIHLSEIESVLASMDQNLSGFLSTKSSNRLNDFLRYQSSLNTLIEAKPNTLYTEEDMLMKNIYYLSLAYQDQAQEAIHYKRQRSVVQYDGAYAESLAIKNDLLSYIDQLNKKQLVVNSMTYQTFVHVIELLLVITFIMITVLILLSLCVVYLINSKMVKPFAHLSHAAEEIAKGNFETEDVVVDSQDEFMILAHAFNKMKNSISDYVEALTLKAETEAKLKDQEMKNIQMAYLLDQAKLYALQSQINPHFLFNTINAGVQMSIMERAKRTGAFLETMANVFRYNLQKIDASCTLGEEVQNIKDYYELLKARFGKKIKFDFFIDNDTLLVQVPPLILQPLVENAYIHGLSDSEVGGTITLTSVHRHQDVIVTIKDDGVGMSQEMIAKVLGGDMDLDPHLGIGIRNVKDRLTLFFHEQNLMKIESSLGIGTKIILRIPEQIEHQDGVGIYGTDI